MIISVFGFTEWMHFPPMLCHCGYRYLFEKHWNEQYDGPRPTKKKKNLYFSLGQFFSSLPLEVRMPVQIQLNVIYIFTINISWQRAQVYNYWETRQLFNHSTQIQTAKMYITIPPTYKTEYSQKLLFHFFHSQSKLFICDFLQSGILKGIHI